MAAEPARTNVFAQSARTHAAALDHALGVTASFSGRAWRFRAWDEETARAIELSGMSAGLARVLAARGVLADEVADFLDPKLKKWLPDPHVLAHMEKAAGRFAQSILDGETIGIVGDYDVDGACSAALVLRYLRKLKREALLYIPDRMTEGYGPSPAAMQTLRARGAALVVTVDCGAAATDALDAARKEGLDVIVLDHHRVERNPPAFAHVNPNGPDDSSGLGHLCAAGVTFCLLVAVQRILRRRGWFAENGLDESDLLDLLDLVALATVADVVPLIGLNRAFVRQGLRQLERLQNPGLVALAHVASVVPPFAPYHLGFVFGPRINAGGRVGQCDLGARLLACDDRAEAQTLAAELDLHNRERQAIEAHILESAHVLAQAQEDAAHVFITGDGWHPGVVGIVASRLKERHSKPVVVAGFTDASAHAVARGSGRSVPGVDLGAMIREAQRSGLLEAGGGHAMAAGFSLRREKMAAFEQFLQAQMEPHRERIAAATELLADALVSASGATLEFIAELERAGPYGAGHAEPVFILPDMHVAYAGVVGNNHLRLRLIARDGTALNAIAFRIADTALGRGLIKARGARGARGASGARVHVAGKLKRDDYGGSSRVQLHLEDAAPAGA